MSGVNFIQPILAAARRQPQRLALRVPVLDAAPGVAQSLSYGELAIRLARMQSALRKLGLAPGARVLLALRPGLDLYVLVIALLGLGLVPVLIDGGMSPARKRAALKASGVATVIGERALLRLWWLLPALWRLRRLSVDGRAWGLRDLRSLEEAGATQVHCELLPEQAHGLITFTSGSTGAPKGADRNHGSLLAQHRAIREHWPDRDDDIDLPSFPVLVLHNLCCGISTVLPEADLARPAQVDAARVLEQIAREGVTRITGAPAYMQALSTAAEAVGLSLPGVRSVVVGGSTVSTELAQACRRVFPQAQARAVYGSTEAEPIADIDLQELAESGQSGPGYLLGRPASVAELRIVEPAAKLACEADIEAWRRPTGRSGEILVAGPHVLQAYVDNPQATRESKIARAGGGVWHRTGDVGQLDGLGRLWLQGRVKDALRLPDGDLHYPLAAEKAVDALPGVVRSALVQLSDGSLLLALAGELPPAAGLRAILNGFGLPRCRLARLDALPVDGRHNSKLDREALREGFRRGRLDLCGDI